MKDSSLTANQWLTKSTKRLEDSEISTARLDSLVLLEDVTGKDRSWLLAHEEYSLSTKQFYALDHMLCLRETHVPLAYVRGKTEFYGREFVINSYVLEPRSETETMIDQLKKIVGNKTTKNILIIDVGTGSGAIAITAKLEIPQSKVIGLDIDQKCLEVASNNAIKLNADIEFLESDLLAGLPSKYSSDPSILLCNLPYVPDSHTINEAAMFEPSIAIFGGLDGLELYRKLFNQAAAMQTNPGYILTESLPFQHIQLSLIAKKHGYHLTVTDDLIQVFVRN